MILHFPKILKSSSRNLLDCFYFDFWPKLWPLWLNSVSNLATFSNSFKLTYVFPWSTINDAMLVHQHAQNSHSLGSYKEFSEQQFFDKCSYLVHFCTWSGSNTWLFESNTRVPLSCSCRIHSKQIVICV